MDDKNKAQPPPYPTQPGMAPYPAQPNAGMPPYPPQPGPAVYGAPAPYPPQSNQGFNFGQPAYGNQNAPYHNVPPNNTYGNQYQVI